MTSPDVDPDRSATAARRSRRRRILSLIGILGAAALIFVLVYFEPQTAFIDDEVSETIPGLDAVLAAEPTLTPALDVTTTIAPASTASGPTTDASLPEPAVPVTNGPATTIPSTTIPATTIPATATPSAGNSIAASLARAAASGEPIVLSSGEFFSGEHTTTGTALVVALPDGSIVVRFEGLDTSNGPDLRVVLSTDEASDGWDYADRLILDELKGNIGDQNYLIDGSVDLTKYRSVVIWCERFSVAFGAASIDAQP